MTSKSDSTIQRIIECARKEFLEAGFHNASLRKIAGDAGVTTGAIYRYFPDKKDLWKKVTQDVENAVLAHCEAMIDVTMTEAAQGDSYDLGKSSNNMASLYELIYQNFDAFYLLLMRSDGDQTVSFLHKIVALEEKSTLAYFEHLATYYQSDYKMDTVALHFLIEAYITAIFEPVRHRMSKEEAIRHAKSLTEYFSLGWLGIEEKMKKDK